MDRLTARTASGIAYLANIKAGEQLIESEYPNTLKAILESFDRLAEYEDKIERGELVEVVRCKECKFHKIIDGMFVCKRHFPCHSNGEDVENAYISMGTNDYCNYGERSAKNDR